MMEDKINPDAFTLLWQYQQLCAEGNVNFQKSIEFQRQPFWLRWQYRQVYRDLHSEGLRLLERKRYLEEQLAVVPLRVEIHLRKP